jgi:hypothetical protein
MSVAGEGAAGCTTPGAALDARGPASALKAPADQGESDGAADCGSGCERAVVVRIVSTT